MGFLWEASSRSPLSLLLSFLCFFANALLDGLTQTSARVCFGCFAAAALVVGTTIENHFLSDQVADLDALDIAPGVISVLGAAMELVVPTPIQKYVQQAVVALSLLVASILTLEYYNDGDTKAIFTFWKRRRAKKTSKRTTIKPSSRRKVYSHPEGAFIQKYEIGKRLGSGFFGTVLMAMSKSTKKHDQDDQYRCFAAKCVNRMKLSIDDELQIRTEAALLMQIRDQHPYIVNIYDFFDEPAHFYIVLELMRGGELFDRIQKKEKYYEKDARIVIRALASALEFLHAQDIVHRDLKPENILLESEGSNSRIKLADFGFARKVERGCTTACGTPNYVAPEIIDGSIYGVAVDIWALGIITYILLAGFPPFADPNRPKLFRLIRQGEVAFPEPHFSLVSYQAQDFIRKCLTKDANFRIKAEEILEHPWILGPTSTSQQRRLRTSESFERFDAGETPGDDTPELSSAQSLIKLFNARQRLRAGILAAIAANRIADIARIVRGKRVT